jgi:hypothetical protein
MLAVSLLLLIFSVISILLHGELVQAQTIGGQWKPPLNLSRTRTNSVEPFALADKSGIFHLFWSEDVGGRPNDMNSVGNTLMYATWDGDRWSTPIDVLLPPYHGPAFQPNAVIDDRSIMHVIWLGDSPTRVYYSFAPADQAGSAGAWSDPITLATDPTATEFSIALAYESPRTLHVIYARVPTGYSPPELRAVAYVRSTDGGATWSDPIDLYTVSDPDRGVSNTRLLVAGPGKVLASWTEWDTTGNGQAIYLARTLNNEYTWEEPRAMALKKLDDYEVDWLRISALDESHLVATFEGGEGAYRYSMFSNDGGATWSTPSRILIDLVGENGFAETALDSIGRLHLFVAQRGSGEQISHLTIGLWHTVWDGKTWSEPELIGGVNPMVNPKVAIAGGNRFVAVWYSSQVGEIMVLTGEIENTPVVEPQPLPKFAAKPTVTLQPTVTPASAARGPSRPAVSVASTAPPVGGRSNAGSAILVGVVPALLVVAIVILVQALRHRER